MNDAARRIDTADTVLALTVREFNEADSSACLRLFESNSPQYFAPPERAEFARFLETNESPFFVALDPSGHVVACGGYYFDRSNNLAGLTWGMVEGSRHGQGIGTQMLLFRLRAIEATSSAGFVRANTSQHSRGFFERHGFVVASELPDGYAPGIDRIEMVRGLAPLLRSNNTLR